MKVVRKFRAGDKIPEGAKYLSSSEELDHSSSSINVREEHVPSIGDYIPIFGWTTTRTRVFRTTPTRTVHYYEVEGAE